MTVVRVLVKGTEVTLHTFLVNESLTPVINMITIFVIFANVSISWSLMVNDDLACNSTP